MKILITNDDGISSKLILLLSKVVKEFGHDPIICVPDKNNSCISQSIKFWEYKDNKLTKVKDNIYTHPGTPTDGIYYYLKEFEAPSLIISGPNIGLNAGMDIQYSGTIGAASEAINRKINAIAISVHENIDEATLYSGLKTVLKFVFENNLYSNEFVYSFNIPEHITSNKIVPCPLNNGKDYLGKLLDLDHLENISENRIKEIGKYSDLYYLLKGYLTVTPILVDRTDYKNIAKIANIFDK